MLPKAPIHLKISIDQDSSNWNLLALFSYRKQNSTHTIFVNGNNPKYHILISALLLRIRDENKSFRPILKIEFEKESMLSDFENLKDFRARDFNHHLVFSTQELSVNPEITTDLSQAVSESLHWNRLTPRINFGFIESFKKIE